LLVPRIGFAQKVHKIGLLTASAPPPGAVEAFRDGMRQRGYVERQNYTLDVRTLRGPYEQDTQTAAGLVESGVDVIVAWSTPAALAARRATTAMPIVIVSVSDPIGTGLVQSLARPGGNLTGVANLGRVISAKQVELFIETVPGLKRIGLVQNQLNPASVGQAREAQEAMGELHLTPQIIEASSAATYEEALLRLSQSGVEGVFFSPDPSAIAHRQVIGEQAIARRLPTMFQRRENVQAGGLMSYGADLVDQFRQATGYVERILKGAKPADLPVEQPTRFELSINVRTAKALGLTIPSKILARADELIE
jgi:putative tryptophan/tyrosine transport system substrate-binding protein